MKALSKKRKKKKLSKRILKSDQYVRRAGLGNRISNKSLLFRFHRSGSSGKFNSHRLVILPRLFRVHSTYYFIQWSIYRSIYDLSVAHVMPPAHISLTLSRHFSLSFIASSPQGYIPYLHIAAVCRFKLVPLLLLGHMRGSIGVHHLWARPCFSSSVLHVWFV